MKSRGECPDDESWELGSRQMPVVESATHMGFLRTSTNQELEAVESSIQKAKRTLYSLMEFGLHGENGLDPETALSLLQTYVLPVLTYRREVIIPTGHPLSILDIQYKKIIKHILSLLNNTADPAIYLLSGTLPIEAIVHKRMLSLFGNITRLSEASIE